MEFKDIAHAIHQILWDSCGMSPEKAMSHMNSFIMLRLIEDKHKLTQIYTLGDYDPRVNSYSPDSN